MFQIPVYHLSKLTSIFVIQVQYDIATQVIKLAIVNSLFFVHLNSERLLDTHKNTTHKHELIHFNR